MLIRCNADFLKLEAGGELHIYGAKSVAAQVHAVLKQQGMAVAGFLVTDSGANPEEIDGLPGRCVYDVSENRRRLRGLLPLPPLHTGVRRKARQHSGAGS